MAASDVPTVVTGDLWSASDQNTYVRDNFAASAPLVFTTKGDLFAATGSKAGVRVGAGVDGQALLYDSGQSAGVIPQYPLLAPLEAILSFVYDTPVYVGDIEALTASGSDTSAETITFAAATPYPTGQAVQWLTTTGGVTAGTVYYLHDTGTTKTTYSVHTSETDALADANRVNITATPTGGMVSAAVYLIPYTGNILALYDGSSGWPRFTLSSQLTQLITGLSASTVYDIFVYDNSGTLAIDAVAWTSTSARATARVFQDGVYVKSGATARRYVGTIYCGSNKVLLDKGGTTNIQPTQRYLYNHYHKRPKGLRFYDATSHNIAAGTTQVWRGISNAYCEFVLGDEQDMYFTAGCSSKTATGDEFATLGLNDAGAVSVDTNLPFTLNGNTYYIHLSPAKNKLQSAGLRKVELIESASGGTATRYFLSGTIGGLYYG